MGANEAVMDALQVVADGLGDDEDMLFLHIRTHADGTATATVSMTDERTTTGAVEIVRLAVERAARCSCHLCHLVLPNLRAAHAELVEAQRIAAAQHRAPGARGH